MSSMRSTGTGCEEVVDILTVLCRLFCIHQQRRLGLTYARLALMSLMLPTGNSGELSLADVFPSCLAALGVESFSNVANLPAARAAIVVLVDGLGSLNLRAAQGHARFLASKTSKTSHARTVFPSTTAAALATLTTGVWPSEHGMLGYKIRDPRSGQVINQLNGLGAISDLESWMRARPLYSAAEKAGVDPYVVSHPRFESTPLTQLLHAGATKVNAGSIDDRFREARRLVSAPGRKLVVVYISELDEIAHKQGVNSSDWAANLEVVDSGLRNLSAELPGDVGVVITADHGVIDIPASKQLLFGDDPKLMADVAGIGGEPRGIQLYLKPGVDAGVVASSWREDFGAYAWVLTREEAISQGLFHDMNPDLAERLGDVMIIARKDVVFYDARDSTLSGRQMIGQHGGLSDAEMRIPLLRLGAFSGD